MEIRYKGTNRKGVGHHHQFGGVSGWVGVCGGGTGGGGGGGVDYGQCGV